MSILWKLNSCKNIKNLIIKFDLNKTCKLHSWKFINNTNKKPLNLKPLLTSIIRNQSSNIKNIKIIKNKSEIKRLLSLAKPEKWNLTGAIIFLIISSAVTMAVPFSIGKLIDIIYTENKDKSRENLKNLGIALLGIFVIGALCNFGRIYCMSTSGHRITRALRKKAYTAILNQETAMFDKVSTGEIVGRLTGDAQLVSSAVTSSISDGLRSGIMTIGGVSMMLYASPELAVVGLSIVPPITIIAVYYGRFIKKISKDVQNGLAQLNTTAEEKISNIRTVKAFAQEINEIKTYETKLNELLTICYKESLYRGMFFGLTGFCGNAMILSVLYYGGVMISDSTITVGSLSAFLLYAAYTGISITGLSNFYADMSKALGASTRLFEFIDRQPKIPISGGKILDHELTGKVTFNNVHYSYPSRDNCSILKNFSLQLNASSVNAIVGQSGSGKSTIALLLLRLYDPNSGCIKLDDYDLKELDPAWVKSQIGFVSQEPVLFNGSIRENISYGAVDATESQIIDAAKLSNVLEFTERMTNGLDTIVGERGITLSGGQRQRVAIARALIKNPKILILDEATSALDAESESYVQDALERATQGRTVLTIAHRLSTIKNSDKIAVLDQGQIMETGNYNELMQLDNGIFKKLVKHQTFS